MNIYYITSSLPRSSRYYISITERGYPVLGRGAMKTIGILLYNRVISGAGTTLSSGAHEFTPGF
jgi:hypothetical protein